VNGVTPPYDGQPIPGFSGMIPSPVPGTYFALPDNGFGAQGTAPTSSSVSTRSRRASRPPETAPRPAAPCR
jgi:hypothetical protein